MPSHTEKEESQGVFTKIGVGLGITKDTFEHDAQKLEKKEMKLAAEKKDELVHDAKKLDKEKEKEVSEKKDGLLKGANKRSEQRHK